MAGPWLQFTNDDWAHAKFCKTCGLPLIKLEDGTWMCVYCAWEHDVLAVTAQQITTLKNQIQQLQRGLSILTTQKNTEIKQLKDKTEWHSPLVDSPMYMMPKTGVMYENMYFDGAGYSIYTDVYMEGYWMSGVEPIYFREWNHPLDK